MPVLSLASVAPVGVLAPGRFAVAGLPLWSAAVRRAEAGLGHARLVCIGDSTTAGFGTVLRAGSWPRQLAGLMSSRGGRETNLFSTANLSGSYDPRIVRGAGWSAISSKGLGGFMLINTTTTNPMTFTPQAAWDTCDLYAQSSQAIRVSIAGTAEISVAANVTVAGCSIRRFSITAAAAGLAPGAHSVSVRYDPTSVVFVGFDCHEAARGIDVVNVGVSGWASADFTGDTFRTAACLPLVRPDLTLIAIGINDWNLATPVTEATFKANIQSLITRAKVTGDVLLIIPNDLGSANAGNRAAYAQYLRDLSTTNGLPPPIDLMDALGSYATANAAGDMIDTLHPSIQGYGKIAALLKTRIG